MARRTNMEELIHCDACGEDYSATYKRCPFCGEKYDTRAITQPADDDDDDGYVFDGQDLFDDDPEDTQVVTTKGGKRLTGTATATRRTTAKPRGGAAAINWPRLITFICSLVIIVAALVIIFTVIFPQIHGDPNPSNSLPAVENSQPVASDPPVDPSGEIDPPVSDEPVIDPTLTRLYMKGPTDMDFTLTYVGESHTLTPGFEPSDWSGEVTFTSSDTNYATVDENGKVTNVNPTPNLRRVTITVSAGGQTVECTVYCRGTTSTESSPPVVTPTPTPTPGQSQAPSGGLTIGAKGTITGASSGLRVRSGPGTTYEILASLVNGNQVTILADAGGGWYQISFSGSNGAATTGYIMGQYISVP